MKRKILFALLMACVGLFFSACQEEEIVKVSEEVEKSPQQPVVVHIDQVCEQGSSLLRSIPVRQSLSKGYYIDLNCIDEPIEYGECEYIPDNSVRYKTMKVKRRNSNKYFYIMVENVGVDIDTACCAYNNQESYVPTYGRLYTWNASNAIAPLFRMRLPVFNINGDSVTTSVVRGRLINQEDIYDLLEVSSLGINSNTGYSIDSCYEKWNHFYADAFIFGTESADGDPTVGYPSLAGSYSEHVRPIHFWYINQHGSFWTSITSSVSPAWATSHQPLSLWLEDNWNYVFSCWAGHNVEVYNSDRLSVRCVFEPRYINR